MPQRNVPRNLVKVFHGSAYSACKAFYPLTRLVIWQSEQLLSSVFILPCLACKLTQLGTPIAMIPFLCAPFAAGLLTAVAGSSLLINCKKDSSPFLQSEEGACECMMLASARARRGGFGRSVTKGLVWWW